MCKGKGIPVRCNGTGYTYQAHPTGGRRRALGRQPRRSRKSSTVAGLKSRSIERGWQRGMCPSITNLRYVPRNVLQRGKAMWRASRCPPTPTRQESVRAREIRPCTKIGVAIQTCRARTMRRLVRGVLGGSAASCAVFASHHLNDDCGVVSLSATTASNRFMASCFSPLLLSVGAPYVRALLGAQRFTVSQAGRKAGRVPCSSSTSRLYTAAM